jgi:hypothetical protein
LTRHGSCRRGRARGMRPRRLRCLRLRFRKPRARRGPRLLTTSGADGMASRAARGEPRLLPPTPCTPASSSSAASEFSMARSGPSWQGTGAPPSPRFVCVRPLSVVPTHTSEPVDGLGAPRDVAPRQLLLGQAPRAWRSASVSLRRCGGRPAWPTRPLPRYRRGRVPAGPARATSPRSRRHPGWLRRPRGGLGARAARPASPPAGGTQRAACPLS